MFVVGMQQTQPLLKFALLASMPPVIRGISMTLLFFVVAQRMCHDLSTAYVEKPQLLDTHTPTLHVAQILQAHRRKGRTHYPIHIVSQSGGLHKLLARLRAAKLFDSRLQIMLFRTAPSTLLLYP